MSDRHPLRPDLIDVEQYRADHHLDADNLPLSLSPDEKEAADKPGEKAEPVMADPTIPGVSPTGVAVVNPTGIAFKLLAVLVAVAAAVAIKQPDLFPGTELDQQIATVLMAIIGFVSPGLRKSA